MFESIYSATVTPAQFFLMAAVTLACGLAFSWLMMCLLLDHRLLILLQINFVTHDKRK